MKHLSLYLFYQQELYEIRAIIEFNYSLGRALLNRKKVMVSLIFKCFSRNVMIYLLMLTII